MLFCGWCRGRGVAPVNATIPIIVDFLVHLHCDTGLSVSAVKGYRAARNSVFSLKGMDLADFLPISMFIRSFSSLSDLRSCVPYLGRHSHPSKLDSGSV